MACTNKINVKLEGGVDNGIKEKSAAFIVMTNTICTLWYGLIRYSSTLLATMKVTTLKDA